MSYPVTDNTITVTELWEVKCYNDSATSVFAVSRSTSSVFSYEGDATELSQYSSSPRGVTFTIGSGNYQFNDTFYFVTTSS
jgi:hypothetical protein